MVGSGNLDGSILKGAIPFAGVVPSNYSQEFDCTETKFSNVIEKSAEPLSTNIKTRLSLLDHSDLV